MDKEFQDYIVEQVKVASEAMWFIIATTNGCTEPSTLKTHELAVKIYDELFEMQKEIGQQ